MPNRHFLPMVAMCIVALPAAGRANVTQDTFLVRSTRDLVDLCAVAPDDPMAAAALNFCHGFGVGVYRVLEKVEMTRKARMYCPPSSNLTRNEAVVRFVQWAKTNPDQLDQPPQDGIVAFLSSQYPCIDKKH